MKTYRKPNLITDKSTRELTYNKEKVLDAWKGRSPPWEKLYHIFHC